MGGVIPYGLKLEDTAGILSLRDVQDTVVEHDKVVDARIARGGGEDGVRCGMGLVHRARYFLGRSRRGRRVAVEAPVARHFLAGGIDDAAVHGVAEVDDVEWGNGMADDKRAPGRIRDGERENGAKQGLYLEQRGERIGGEIEQTEAGRDGRSRIETGRPGARPWGGARERRVDGAVPGCAG